MAIFMQIPGFIGSSTDQNHLGWIELDAVNFNVRRGVANKLGSCQLRDVAMPSIGAISITKAVDKSSPHLLNKMLKGAAIPQVQINICRTGSNGSTSYARYILKDVLISEYEDSTLGLSADTGKEYLKLSFTNLQKTFIPYDADGDVGSPITTGYDLPTATVS